jgi:hypothetical protein
MRTDKRFLARQAEEGGRISKDDELIRKSSNGVFVMYKSHFDFLEKPLP